MIRSASLSKCGRYRYSLERRLPDVVACAGGASKAGEPSKAGGPSRASGASKARLCWLMLNPSTADGTQDDPTIRKVIGFTRRAGYRSALVVNLFAWRATDPRELRKELLDPRARAEGARNRAAVVRAASVSDAVVCAWGATPWARGQATRVLRWLRPRAGAEQPRLLCLGTTKHGAPLHPLMLSYDGHPLVAFTA